MIKKKPNLEEVVKKNKKNTWSSIIDYLIPALDKYDHKNEAIKLGKELSNKYSHETVLDAIKYSYENNKNLLLYAKLADTTDKVTSLLAAPIEGILVHFGIAPGFAANLIEETIELAVKSPYLINTWKKPKNRPEAIKLGIQELGTMATPVLGDVYDFVRNNYMKSAKDIIKKDAQEYLTLNNKIH